MKSKKNVVEDVVENKLLNVSSTYDLGTRTLTLGRYIITDQTLNLPMLRDTIALEFDLSLSSKLNKPIPRVNNYTRFIDHIQLATAQGIIKALIPGKYIELLHLLYSESHNKMITAPSKNSEIVPMFIPNIKLPRSYGPWQLTVFYKGINKRADLVLSNHIRGYYGNAKSGISRYLYQTCALVGGTNMIQTTAVPQNVPISELILSGLSNVYDIEQILMQSNGMIIEPNTSGAVLVARKNALLPHPYDNNTVVLHCPTRFVLNSSSEFQIVLKRDSPNAQFLWLWYEGGFVPSQKFKMKRFKWIDNQSPSLRDLDLPPPPPKLSKTKGEEKNERKRRTSIKEN